MNYPDATFKYGDDGDGTTFTTNVSPPFYYNLASMQWCDAPYGWKLRRAPRPAHEQNKNTFRRVYPRRHYAGELPRVYRLPKRAFICGGNDQFHNWYAYYRDRLSMMKTGVGRAFRGLDDNYRVGFMTIHTTPTDTSRFIRGRKNKRRNAKKCLVRQTLFNQHHR